MSADLLQPTLTAEDDAQEMRQPWNPWALVMLAFFFGLPAGGGLLALNFSRLGMRPRLVLGIGLVVAGTVALAALRAWLLGSGVVDPLDREQRRYMNFGLQAGAVLIAIALAGMQRRRFRLFDATGAPGGSLWLPGFLAVVASFAIQIALRLLFQQVFGGGSRT